MWTVLKFNKKYYNLLKNELKEKIGKDLVFYYPKAVYQSYKKNKITSKEINLLGDYLICFHKKFENRNTIREYKNTRGLQYFLKDYLSYQGEIKDFIEKCKNLENQQGYVSHKIFDLKKNYSYKFFSGPFLNMVFKIIEVQKNKIKILVGNIETIVKKEEHCFKPI